MSDVVAPSAMRKPLVWALGTTVGLSALALWKPQDSAPIVAAAKVMARGTQEMDRVVALAGDAQEPSKTAAGATGRPLPEAWPEHQALEHAQRDVFGAVLPPPVKAPAPPPPPPQVVVAPPPPVPPPMNYRYMGRFVDPAGQLKFYLAKGDAPLEVAAGAKLEDGYVVESINDDGVLMVYPPLGVKMMLAVPKAQQ